MTTRSQPGLLPGFLLMRVRRQKIGASRDLPPSILQRRSACGPLRHRGFGTILKHVCRGHAARQHCPGAYWLAGTTCYHQACRVSD